MSRKKSLQSIVGIREKNKLDAIFAEITGYEKEASKLLAKTALAYFNAGNILYGIIRQWNNGQKSMSARSVAEVTGYPERKILIALKIHKHFANNPEALKDLTLRDTLKLIAPAPPAGEEGYNRADLGGDPGQMKFDFGELFEVPAAGNLLLKNYRTVGDRLSDIIVVRRTDDNLLISKRFAHFAEDIPQDTELRHAYKIMSQKTQAAIEDYLAAVEQEESK